MNGLFELMDLHSPLIMLVFILIVAISTYFIFSKKSKSQKVGIEHEESGEHTTSFFNE